MPWKDKNYAREYRRKWQRGKKARAWYAARNAQNLALIRVFKNRPCADCGNSYPPIAMDFDHVRGVKRFSVSHGLNYPAATIIKEIEKCEVVCANCHRIRHG